MAEEIMVAWQCVWNVVSKDNRYRLLGNITVCEEIDLVGQDINLPVTT